MRRKHAGRRGICCYCGYCALLHLLLLRLLRRKACREARELLLRPEVVAAGDVGLEWEREADDGGVVAFLVGEKGFSDARWSQWCCCCWRGGGGGGDSD